MATIPVVAGLAYFVRDHSVFWGSLSLGLGILVLFLVIRRGKQK